MRADNMNRRRMLGATAVALALGASLMLSQPAAARDYCEYRALDSFGKVVASGHGSAVKMSWACNRAERRCKRNLKGKGRPFKGCHRVGQAR
jgi:hypothetical protein